MRAAQGFVPALLLAAGAVASSCGGDDFCSPGSYECSGGTQPSAGKSGAGTGGSSGDAALGGSTGTGGSAAATSGTAGSMSVGGTAGIGEAGAGAGGQSGSTGSGGTAATGGTGGSNGGAGEGGAGGTGPSKCDPSSPEADCVLTGLAGIFVATHASGGDDANNGTQSAPVATLTHAIDLAVSKGVSVYVCAGTYKEHIEITDDDVTLHGGFTCAQSVWTYAPSNHSRIAPTTKNEALRIKGVIGLDVTDMDLVAADATAPGASSVGVFVSGSKDIVFTRVHVTAGNGADGEAGTLGASNHYADDLGGTKGSDGGGAKPCACPDGSTTTGGSGGIGGLSPTGGGAGLPALSGGGAGGMLGSCGSGGTGHDGSNSEAIADASGAEMVGTIGMTGWVPAPGTAGGNGMPGQGGGGGAGNASGTGGGGACGGCGGTGGGAGNGAGGSIAVVAVGSKVEFRSCLLETTTGGKGGAGIGGEAGQTGGMQGNGELTACDGGLGGTGSDGGAGGGGAGGISVGIVYDTSTSVVSTDSSTVITPGTFGAGGLGGGTNNPGMNGVAAELLPI